MWTTITGVSNFTKKTIFAVQIFTSNRVRNIGFILNDDKLVTRLRVERLARVHYSAKERKIGKHEQHSEWIKLPQSA